MWKDFFGFMFHPVIDVYDKNERLIWFLFFLGKFEFEYGGEDVFGDGEPTLWDKIYKYRYGFTSAWNLSGHVFINQKKENIK